MHAPKRSRELIALLFPTSLALALLLGSGCVTQVPLADPGPIAAAATPTQTRTAVLLTLVRYEWVVVSEEPGKIVARTGAPDWNMVVAIEYASQVSLHYVSSENLDYDTSQGAPRIHAGYNKRVRAISDGIAREIALINARQDFPVAAPPPPAPAASN